MSRKKFQNIATILGLGKRLREIRGGESQDSFGRRNFGLGKSTISKFEADIMVPDFETLEKYAALGKTTKERLLKGEDRQVPQIQESAPEPYELRPAVLNIDDLVRAKVLSRQYLKARRLKFTDHQEAQLETYIYEYLSEYHADPGELVIRRLADLIKKQEG